MSQNNLDVPVVILSGGYGIYIDASGVRKAKANILIHQKPLIYYVLLSYLRHGFRKFVVSGSYQLSETESLLKNTFKNGLKYKNDSFVLTIIDSGKDTKTGSRVKRALETHKSSKNFAVTYSDSISLQNLNEELEFHVKGNLSGTLTGTRLPTRFRILGTRPGENVIRGFSERPLFKGDYINGGYYFFKTSTLSDKNLFNQESVTLETDVLDALVKESQLTTFIYEGGWHHVDCERDLTSVSALCLNLEKES